MNAGWKVVRLLPEQMGLWDERPGNWVGWIGWRSQVSRISVPTSMHECSRYRRITYQDRYDLAQQVTSRRVAERADQCPKHVHRRNVRTLYLSYRTRD